VVISRGIDLYSSIAEVKTSFIVWKNYIGYIVAQDFTLEAPHIIKTGKQKIIGEMEGVPIKVNLSQILRRKGRDGSAGMSWRPPTSATVKLEVEAGAEDFTYLQAYFRYSCDRVHWSTWYNLRSLKPQDGIAASVYESNLSIPRMAQAPYYAKMQEWWKTNPPWSSDEHELCVWITSQDPDFFSREFPFIGYVQVRIEGETRGVQLKSLSIKVSSAIGGLTTLSKGRGRSTTGEKWFFENKIRR
jgi:hypothetical protein